MLSASSLSFIDFVLIYTFKAALSKAALHIAAAQPASEIAITLPFCAYSEIKSNALQQFLIISSGTKEIIEGTSIAKEFKEIYACEFLFDENGIASWPKIAINYTAKTQFVFRVSKGALDSLDVVGVNSKSSTRRVPYGNIVYLGDGLTDIPCMTLVKEKGGKSIAIYPKGKKEKVYSLFEEGRVNYICRSDYSANSDLEKIIKLIINQASIVDDLSTKEIQLSKK